MKSYWERESILKCKYAVVGSGLYGLWTAYHLLEKEPFADLFIIERGILPTGASTKNAGFACFGSYSEILEDLKMLKPQEVLQQVTERYNGINFLKQTFGPEI